MNRINNNADGGNRQIQPRDFSFLSEADQFLEKTIVAMAYKLFGYDPDEPFPIVIDGIKLVCSDNGTAVENLYLTHGLFVFVNKIWSFPGFVWYKDFNCEHRVFSQGTQQNLVGDAFYYELKTKIAPPSPVWRDDNGNNMQDMDVHEVDVCDIVSTGAPLTAKILKMRNKANGVQDNKLEDDFMVATGDLLNRMGPIF